MTKYTLKVTSDFTDAITGQLRQRGTTLETDDLARVRLITSLKLGKIKSIEHEPKPGKRVLFVSSLVYKIGGIETANRAISEHFRSKNIAFLTLNADETATEQLIKMAEAHDVFVDDGETRYKADIVILQHTASAVILPRIEAGKVYQQVNCNLTSLKKLPSYANFTFTDSDKIDKYLAVSQTAKESLEREEGKQAVIVPNLMPEPRKLLKMVVLSRASREKGIDRVLTLAQKLQKYTDDFVIFLASAIEQYEAANELLANDHIVPVRPSVYNEALLDGADYLIQLSRSEAFCYSVREALQHKVPVIVSDLEEFRKVVKDGENGYILAEDMPDEQVKRIVEHVPTVEKPYTQAVAPIWHRVLKGEL